MLLYISSLGRLSSFFLVFVLKIFLTWTFFKVFIEFVTTLLLFCVSGFLAEGCVASWHPDQGLNPHPMHLNLDPKPLDLQGSPIICFVSLNVSPRGKHEKSVFQALAYVKIHCCSLYLRKI